MLTTTLSRRDEILPWIHPWYPRIELLSVDFTIHSWIWQIWPTHPKHSLSFKGIDGRKHYTDVFIFWFHFHTMNGVKIEENILWSGRKGLSWRLHPGIECWNASTLPCVQWVFPSLNTLKVRWTTFSWPESGSSMSWREIKEKSH